MSFQTIATIKNFGGKLLKLSHLSSTTGCEMSLNLYMPSTKIATTTSTASSTTTTITTTTTTNTNTNTNTETTFTTKSYTNEERKIPVLFFLSGLTCTGNNCAEKGFFQHAANQKGIAIVYPDTSPRGLGIQGEDDSYDIGTGASFYVNATQSPWSANYQMESYITRELPEQLFKAFPELDASRISITGHSMGGHGALTLFLKNPTMYKSVSAFAPICSPRNCTLAQKALTAYFGSSLDNDEKWKMNDATSLLKRWDNGPFPCLIDVGTCDEFYLDQQLLPEQFYAEATLQGVAQDLEIRYQEGYDHSYFFVSSFAQDHVNFAAKFLFA